MMLDVFSFVSHMKVLVSDVLTGYCMLHDSRHRGHDETKNIVVVVVSVEVANLALPPSQDRPVETPP